LKYVEKNFFARWKYEWSFSCLFGKKEFPKMKLFLSLKFSADSFWQIWTGNVPKSIRALSKFWSNLRSQKNFQYENFLLKRFFHQNCLCRDKWTRNGGEEFISAGWLQNIVNHQNFQVWERFYANLLGFIFDVQ